MISSTRAGIRTPPGRDGGLRWQPGDRRRRRVPEIALGVLLVAGFGLGFALWHTSSVESEPVLVLARAVVRGDVIEPADLRTASVRLGGAVDHLRATEAERVVGRVARFDLAPGTLLTSVLVAAPAQPQPSDRIVGLLLGPGAYPSAHLRRGDRVQVVRTSGGGTADPHGPEVVGEAVVWDLDEQDDGTGTLLVSLVVAAADAPRVLDAGAADTASLALIGGGA